MSDMELQHHEIGVTVQMDLHRRMVRIRLFEEAAGRLAEGGKLPGFLHLYVGEEAVAAGVCAALNDDDQITSTHRGHGHLVAKGGDFNRMMAELMGKATGYNKGKGGSMHICDLDLGMLGANGIVGAGSPIAVGAAFADRYRGRNQVAVAFFGDGATNIGAFHEAANMACALHLPIVFACENNEYGEFTPRDKTMAITDIVDRAAGYGMPGVIVDGMDVIAVHEAAVEAVQRARDGGGPALIEAKTYRFYNHHGVQNLGLKYRTDDEVADMKKRDPVFSFEERLIEAGSATEEQIDDVWEQLRADIETAIKFAEDSPLPEPSDLFTGVYTGSATTATGASR
jgi:acetoin:2,6-dichlorophenolindophenol oxidoreductase subunit alpha